MKEICPHATIIAEETNLTKYQPGFDAENKKMATPSYKVTDLIPPIRKHTFAAEIDPSGLIDDEAEFVALHGFDWSKPNFQTVEVHEPTRDESQPSSQPGQDSWTGSSLSSAMCESKNNIIVLGSKRLVIG